jgi:outer membrane lipoprotein-sorting protein
MMGIAVRQESHLSSRHWQAMIAVILLLLVPAGTASAKDAIDRAEHWFNNLKTIAADFVQIASDGTAAKGKLQFMRPARMKISYEDTAPLNLITTPIWLHVDRPDERTIVSYPLSETPLSLILAETVSLRPAGYTTRLAARRAGLISIEISKDSGDDAGRLTLEFSEKPFALRRWIIVDSAGIETAVTLQNAVYDKAMDVSLFRVPTYESNN